MKICSTCKIEKELTEYYTINKTKADGTPYIYYRPDCKKCTYENAVKWQKANPEKRKIHQKKQNKRPEKRQQIKEHSKRFRDSGAYYEYLKINNKSKKYRENRQQNKVHNISKDEWVSCKKYFDCSCAYCGLSEKEHRKLYKQDLHKEHVVHDGANDISNCVPACKVCNSSKHVASLTDWYSDKNPNYNEDRLEKIYSWLNFDVHRIEK